MVLGGERDEFIPATDVMLTGLYYGVTPSIVRGCAHAIMLERNWETAADLVCEWLIRRFGRSGSGGIAQSNAERAPGGVKPQIGGH